MTDQAITALQAIENSTARLVMAQSSLFFTLEALEDDAGGTIRPERAEEYVNALHMVYGALRHEAELIRLATVQIYDEARKQRTATVEG